MFSVPSSTLLFLTARSFAMFGNVPVSLERPLAPFRLINSLSWKQRKQKGAEQYVVRTTCRKRRVVRTQRFPSRTQLREPRGYEVCFFPKQDYA